MGGKAEFSKMLDSVFVVPPIYDDSYYGARIHEITEMQVANMGNYAHRQPARTAHDLPLRLCRRAPPRRSIGCVR